MGRSRVADKDVNGTVHSGLPSIAGLVGLGSGPDGAQRVSEETSTDSFRGQLLATLLG
jgi:hypothetical protein